MLSKIGMRETLLIGVLDKSIQGQLNEYGVTQVREWLAREYRGAISQLSMSRSSFGTP
jgi:hypothetical protein